MEKCIIRENVQDLGIVGLDFDAIVMAAGAEYTSNISGVKHYVFIFEGKVYNSLEDLCFAADLEVEEFVVDWECE